MDWNWQSAFEHIKFIVKKPLVGPRIMAGFFNKNILKKNVLRTVDLAVTYDCHYKCQYCSAFLLKKEREKVLSPKQIKKLWEEAIKLGAIHVNLTGGEPLMRNIDELCEIVRSLSPKNTLISLVTNSLFVTEEKLKKLKEAGLDTIQFSIESLNPEVNDRIRGVKGVFEKTMKSFYLAKSLGLNICLSAVLCRENQEEIQKLLDFAKKERVFLLINTASSVSRRRDNKDVKMRLEDINIFEKFIKDKNVRNDTSFNFSGKRECPGGKERIHITGYGEVLTCPLVQVGYGNVLKEPLKNIYEKMNVVDHIKKYSKLCKQSFDKDYYEKVCLPAEKSKKPPLNFKDL